MRGSQGCLFPWPQQQHPSWGWSEQHDPSISCWADKNPTGTGDGLCHSCVIQEVPLVKFSLHVIAQAVCSGGVGRQTGLRCSLWTGTPWLSSVLPKTGNLPPGDTGSRQERLRSCSTALPALHPGMRRMWEHKAGT